MRVIERQTIAKLVIQYYTQKAIFNKRKTVQHFREQGEKGNTIYSIIKRFEKTGSYEFRPKSGRKRRVSTPEMIRKVIKNMINTNRSVRQTAKKLNINRGTVQVIKKREGIRTEKCKTVPKMTELQQKTAKTNSRKILQKSANKVLILDDETYIPVDPSDTKVSKHFNFIDKRSVPKEVQFNGKTKFPKQFLVWQAIDEYGNTSEPYVKKGTLTSNEYLEECLKKRLIPFIEKYHKNNEVMFWPDMATIHYAKTVTDWLKSKKIPFIEKYENIPNCPHARPIEKFWAFCKLEYSKRSIISKSLIGFNTVWKNLSLKVAQKSGYNLMSTVRKRLREIQTGGAFGPFTIGNRLHK